MAQDYFTEELQQNVDYFDIDNTRVPFKPEVAAEAGTVSGILSTGTLTPEGFNLASQVQSNLEILGNDPVYQNLGNSERESWKTSLKQLGTEIFADSVDPKEDLMTLQQSLEAVDKIPNRPLLNTAAAESQMSQGRSFFYDEMLNATMVQNSMSDILNSAMGEISEEGSIGDALTDFGELLTASPVTEKVFRAGVMDKLGLSDSTVGYAFRSGDEDKIIEWIQDGKQGQEIIQRTVDFIDAVKESEGGLGQNGFYSTAFLDQVREKLLYDTNSATFDDIMDVFTVADVGAAVRGLKYLGSRVLGRLSSKSGGADVKSYKDLAEAAQQAADDIVPRMPKRTKVAEAVEDVLPQRLNKGSFLDSMYVSNPDMVKAALSASPDEAVSIIKGAGATPQQLSERFMPGVKGEGHGMHISSITGESGSIPVRSPYDTRIQKDIENQIDRLARQSLYTRDEVMHGMNREIAKVQEQSSAVMQPQYTEIPTIKDDSDVLEFKTVFGKSYSDGYESLDEAKDAASFLFQEDGKTILARMKGSNDAPSSIDNFDEGAELEYFIQAELKHTMVPMDANPFGDKVWGSFPVIDYLIPWSNRISNDMFNTLNGFTDRASALAQRMTDLAQPIRKLKGSNEKSQWTKLLMHGDQHQMTFSKDTAREYLGGRMSDRVWDSYTASRQYFDILFNVRNKKEYLELSDGGFKSIKVGDGLFKDQKGRVFGRPVPDVQLDSASKLVNTLGEEVQYADDLAARIQGEGGVIVRTNRDITFDGENYYDHVVVPRRDSVGELPLSPLDKRTGHVDVHYRGEDGMFRQLVGGHKGGTGYIVQRTRGTTRNGLADTRDETVAIFANKLEANKWISKQEDPDVYKTASTRELKGELGIDGSGSLSGIPSHALGRGERLQGANGLAEILDPEEAMQVTQNEIRTRLGIEAVDYLKSKWMSTYAKHTARDENGRALIQGFPRDTSGILFRDESADMVPEAERWFDFIVNQERGLTGKRNTAFMDSIRRGIESMYNTDGIIFKPTSRFLKSALDTMPLDKAAKLNQLLFIAARVQYQTVANAQQVAYMMARDPIVFTTQTIPRTLSVMSGLALRSVDNADSSMMGLLGKSFGMDANDFNKYLKQIEESGISSTGVSDDIVSILTDSTKVAAGDRNVRSMAFWKRLPSRATVKPLVMPQEWATKFANLTSYVHSTNLYMKSNKTKNIFSNVAKNEIDGTARKLSFTQNRADQMAYQQNAAGITLQFMHHVQKMFTNTFLDPSVKMLTGRNIAGKQGANIYAETRGQAFRVMAGTLGTFGLASMPFIGDSSRDMLDGALEGVPDEVKTAVLDGYLNVLAESMTGEKFDFASRFAALDFYESALSFLFDENGGVMLLGPTQSTFKSLVDVWKWVDIHHNNPHMDTEEFLQGALKEAGRSFAGLRDLDRARVAYNYGRYITADGRTLAEIDPSASWLVGFSVTPQKVTELYRNMDTEADTRDFVDRVVDQGLRRFMDEIREMPDATSTEIQDAAIKHLYQVIWPALGGQDNPAVYEQARRKYENYLFRADSDFLQNYGDKIFKISINSNEVLSKLERFKEQYPEQAERIDYYIKLLEQEKQNNQEEQE